MLAVPVGSGIRWLGLFLRPYVERRMLLLTPVVGLAVAGLAIAFAAATGKGSAEVLFSGQSALGPFDRHTPPATPSERSLLLLACKGLAYGMSLSSFRGGPTFPALFLGAAGGVALSHLPGLPLVDGVAMGIGAMSVVMLRLPADLRPAGLPAAGLRRPGRHAAGDRGRRGGLRPLGEAHPEAGR